MQKVGVEAVVEGLGAFISDMGSINRAMDQLRPQGTLLQRMFEGVGEGLRAFGREVLNVAEVALGVLLARAVEFVIGKLKELVSATIEAGSQFQTMSLRLTRLNFNSMIESGADYVNVMDAAKKATQEQLEWIQKLAIQTPYDAADIANVFTLARSYGFASGAAQDLTGDIANFAAGMGLGNTEIRRIIVNFGQMVQQGKVTQRELNDLARGAFVPVNDVLKKMQEETGLTGDAFDKFKVTGEGVQAFFTAFSDLVKERFAGAANDMARTFGGATANAQDFIKSLLGLSVVKPVLDVIGGKIADLVNSLTTEKNWDALTKAANRVGESLSSVVADVLGLLPATDDLAGQITDGLSGVADWIDTHHDDIMGFFKGLNDIVSDIASGLLGIKMPDMGASQGGGTKFDLKNKGDEPKVPSFLTDIQNTINNVVIPAIDDLKKAFDTIKTWTDENGPTIKKFFETLGEIIGTVFENLTGGKLPAGGGLDGFLESVTTFMQTVIDNKDQIAEWATKLIEVWLALQGIGTVLNIVIGVVVAILVPILAFLAVLAGLVGVWTILGPLLLAVGGFILTTLIPAIVIAGVVILGIIAILALFVGAFILVRAVLLENQAAITAFVGTAIENFTALKDQAVASFEELRAAIIEKVVAFVVGAVEKIQELVSAVKEKVAIIKSTFSDQPWGRIGRDIIEGVTRGVLQAVSGLIAAVVNAVSQAYDAALGAIGANSPSKLFMNVGEFAMQGMAKGITASANLAVGAMQQAVGAMSMPALGLPSVVQQYTVGMGPSVNTNTTLTNNFTLAIASSAPTEPIIQDFNMMQSLVQG